MTKKRKLNSKNPKYKSAKELVVREVEKKVLIGKNGVKAYATFYK
jgi:hypothetical protein